MKLSTFDDFRPINQSGIRWRSQTIAVILKKLEDGIPERRVLCQLLILGCTEAKAEELLKTAKKGRDGGGITKIDDERSEAEKGAERIDQESK